MGKIIKVKNFPNRSFAEQAQDILHKNDIWCVIKSPDVGITGLTSSALLRGVDLYVKEEDKNKAYQLLNAIFNGI